MFTKSLPKLPERPKPLDPKKIEDGGASGKEQEQERTLAQTLKRTSWMPSLGRSEYIVLSLLWALYSIFNVLAYRNGGT